MERNTSYIGFPPLPDKDHIVTALVHDPPQIRWRVVRDLFQIREPEDREDLIERLRSHLFETEDFMLKSRLTLALQALHHQMKQGDYVLVKGKGAFKPSQVPQDGVPILPAEMPLVDFHIHPKSPDMKFFSDIRDAGVTHGVILATDTDPSDADNPEIIENLRLAYSKSPQSRRVPFERIIKHIKASLFSPTHVTNQDVADWVNDYPDILIGFGSVDLSKDRAYVDEKLERLRHLNMRGIKLLPHSQFFDPYENENAERVFKHCQETCSVILSHSGCGPGPFEVPELSQNSHPERWEPLLKKYPDVPLVLAHFGAYSTNIPGIWLYQAMQMGKKYKNVYADLAAVDWILTRDPAVNEIRNTIGFDRVLFGTDYPLPLTSGTSLAYIVNSIKANTHLTQEEKQKVLGGNAARLLGI